MSNQDIIVLIVGLFEVGGIVYAAVSLGRIAIAVERIADKSPTHIYLQGTATVNASRVEYSINRRNDKDNHE